MTDKGVVVHVSATDGTGGAGRAALRLHQGLTQLGWESWMAAGLRQLGGDRSVELNALTREHKSRVSGWLEAGLHVFGGPIGERRLPVPSTRAFPETELFKRADVVHLHNLHGSYFDYGQLPRLAQLRPLAWTLHDMWATTGHCAYSFSCGRWKDGCHDCPMFSEWAELDEIRRTPRDNSRPEWLRKQATFRATPLSVTAPTKWLKRIAEESILSGHPETTFRHIPYGIDSSAYRPVSRRVAREELGVPSGSPVILFSAAALDDARKGIPILTEALAGVRSECSDVILLTMGSADGLPAGLQQSRPLGQLSTPEEQRRAYAAADVVALPTRADNQPLVMLEALACGTPVVGFDVGGVPETVRDGETGLLVPDGNSTALARALIRLLVDPTTAARMGASGRAMIEAEHDLERQASEHARLYRDLVAARSAPGGGASSRSLG